MWMCVGGCATVKENHLIFIYSAEKRCFPLIMRTKQLWKQFTIRLRVSDSLKRFLHIIRFKNDLDSPRVDRINKTTFGTLSTLSVVPSVLGKTAVTALEDYVLL